MFKKIKHFLYFPVASYFRFFAAIRLKKWNPRIIVITGSSGKTTLLHLVESQLENKAKYTHEANSSFGIPFDVLNIHRRSLTLLEWPIIFVLPWINVFKSPPKEKIYVVEADCDRPNEGKFLSSLLKPEVTLWTNISRTHTMNFDRLVKSRKFESVDEAIAHEFGFFVQETNSLVVINKDFPLVEKQLYRAKCKKVLVSGDEIGKYWINLVGTQFETKMGNFSFPYLLPKEVGLSVLMCLKLLDYLDISPDNKFSEFKLPPGRNSFFKGIKGITIIDSSYNANLDSMTAIINMFGRIQSNKKWLVIGDMLEQGEEEAEEHRELADSISKFDFKRVVLMGPRVSKYTYPELEKMIDKSVQIEHFLGPKKVLDYLNRNILGSEIILFKGARFLEGVVENLLLDKNDIANLARREKVWQIRRKKWGL